MKKIIFSLSIIAVTVAAAGFGSYALWSDQETVSGNSIQADKLDLVSISAPISIANATPGASGASDAIELANNSSSVSGELSFSISNTSEYENGCVESESNEGGDITCGSAGLGEGELGQYMKVGIISDLDGDGTFETNVTEDYLSNLNGPYVIGSLAAGDTAEFKVTYTIDNSANPFEDNIFMTDSVEFDVDFTLTQN